MKAAHFMGSSTPSAAATAIAASNALPPRCMMERPMNAAAGCAEHTMPRVPYASGRRWRFFASEGSSAHEPSSIFIASPRT